MGTDIHPHLEVKVGSHWHHYSCPTINRNYELFTYLQDTFPIRGIPQDSSVITKHDFLMPGNNWKHTWLDVTDLRALHKWCHERIWTNEEGDPDPNGEFNEYYFDLAWELNPNHYVGVNSYKFDDVRFVFWFDN